jgi:hypothetical protein
VRGPLDLSRLREALAWLQTQHPILRAHITYGGLVFRDLPPFVYRQPSFVMAGTTEIPLKVIEDTDPEAWRHVLAKEVRTPIKRGRHPRLRITLVRTSAGADLAHIVICADHATLDAQSGNMLSRHLLEYLADPAAARQRVPVHTSLPPALEEGLPKKPDSGTRGYEPAIRLPKHPITRPKAETRVLSRRLEPAIAEDLRTAVRANRTTIHGAVAGAFLMAVRARYSLETMSVLTTIDLRRLMKPALSAETYGCYIDILRTTNAIRADYWTTAREASFKLISTLAKDQEPASILKLFDWEVYRKEMRGLITHNRRIDGLAVTTAGESGLRRHYGELELIDVTMGVSLDMFGPSIFVIASEREGGIDLSIGYAADAISDEEVAILSDSALAFLTQPAAADTTTQQSA